MRSASTDGLQCACALARWQCACVRCVGVLNLFKPFPCGIRKRGLHGLCHRLLSAEHSPSFFWLDFLRNLPGELHTCPLFILSQGKGGLTEASVLNSSRQFFFCYLQGYCQSVTAIFFSKPHVRCMWASVCLWCRLFSRRINGWTIEERESDVGYPSKFPEFELWLSAPLNLEQELFFLQLHSPCAYK